MQRIGILGGTFNPVHLGHLMLANAASERFTLDRVIWLPTHVPPHKSHNHPVDFRHRLEMVKQAIAPYTKFEVSEIERQRSGISYAAETLLELNALYPNDVRYWIMGFDAFLALPRWHRLHEIATSCYWLIAPRPLGDHAASTQQTNRFDIFESNFEFNIEVGDRSSIGEMEYRCHLVAQTLQQRGISIHWHLIPMKPIKISSSLIRQHYDSCPSIRYWVPNCVRAYINKYQLYRWGS